MRNDRQNLIVELTFTFALNIIAYSEEIKSVKKFEMSSQIFRSGTSIGANTREAQNAESKANFIHKFKLLQKRQTKFITGLRYVNHQHFIRIRMSGYLQI